MPAPTPPDRLDELGRMIWSARKTRGLSQDDLAALLETSQSVVSQLERGDRGTRVSAAMALRLEAVLGLSVADVMRAAAARMAARRDGHGPSQVVPAP